MNVIVARGYRVRPGTNLLRLLDAIKRRASENASEALQELYIKSLTSPSMLQVMEEWTGDNKNNLHGDVLCSSYFLSKFRTAAATGEDSPENLSVHLDIWEHRGAVYIRAVCGWKMSGVLDFLDRIFELEDFSYYSTMRRPSTIPNKHWTTRAAVWGDILTRTDGNPLLRCTVLSPETYYSLDPTWRAIPPTTYVRSIEQA